MAAVLEDLDDDFEETAFGGFLAALVAGFLSERDFCFKARALFILVFDSFFFPLNSFSRLINPMEPLHVKKNFQAFQEEKPRKINSADLGIDPQLAGPLG